MSTPNMLHITIIIFYSLLFINRLIECRTVPAKDDICTRYPQFSLCLGNGQLQPGGTPPSPPTAPPPVEKQTLDRDTYCKKYQLHFTYFCSPGVDQGPNAQDFCKAYGKNCDVKAAPQAYTKDQITAECSKKKSLAETYCTGNEPDAIRGQCDQYRQYCLNGQQAPAATAAPVVANPIFDPVQYCTSYQPAYIQACATPRPPQGNIGRKRKRRQGDPAALAAAAGYTPEKIAAMCTQYQSLASSYCTGNEPAGQIKDKCNLYRTYCLKQANVPSAPAPQWLQLPLWHLNNLSRRRVRTVPIFVHDTFNCVPIWVPVRNKPKCSTCAQITCTWQTHSVQGTKLPRVGSHATIIGCTVRTNNRSGTSMVPSDHYRATLPMCPTIGEMVCSVQVSANYTYSTFSMICLYSTTFV